MRLTELIDQRCVTEDGRVLGRVFELRAERRGNRLVVTDLLLGRPALLERYGVGRHRRAGSRRGDVTHEVAWSDVVRTERGRIVVRLGSSS
jgi:hypothetical protein